jgi:tetratricopeptide (TPR) repeat protein
LVAVLEHNRLDLLSLALLTSHAARLLEKGPQAAGTAREAYGLGRLYERAGMTADARECFVRAGDLHGDTATHAEALRAYAALCRRERRYEDAATAWERILRLQPCPPQIVREATDALAVHHEHRRRDPRTARDFALQALQFHGTPTRRHAIHHRLARLDRKMGERRQAAAPLF